MKLSIGDIKPTVFLVNYSKTPRGTTWGPRTIGDFELILVVHGRYRYREGDTEDVVGVGAVLAIPPGVVHTLIADPASSFGDPAFSCMHLELLSNASCAAGDYSPDPMPPRVTDTHLDPTVHDLFRRSSRLFRAFHPYRAELLSAMARELWIRLAGYWVRPEEPRLSGRMEDMVAFIRERLSGPLSRRDIADTFGLTPEHINALFKKELGISPVKFIQRERVAEAYSLLAEDKLTVKEVASKVGFNDPYYFSRVFKRVTGRAPVQVRRR